MMAAEPTPSLEAAPWAKDTWFVLTTGGDGQGTSLHRGWDEICEAVIAVHYFKPDADQRREVMERFTDWDDWQDIDHTPWQWSASYEGGFVTVERVTDPSALDRLAAARVEAERKRCAAIAGAYTRYSDPGVRGATIKIEAGIRRGDQP